MRAGKLLGATRSGSDKAVDAFVVAVADLAGGAVIATVDPQLHDGGFALSMAVLGVGMGLIVSQLGNVVQSSVDASGRGEAGGLQYTGQQLGSSLGVALIGAIVLAGLTTGFLQRIEADERITEAVGIAGAKGISILEVTKNELDRMSSNGLHQGIGLQVPPYVYAHPDDLMAQAIAAGQPPLLVALDNITDPRNLGAVIRSVAAFGGHGVLIPQRRSASVTAVAWRTSAGAAARLPVAQAPNLTRTLKDWAKAGAQIVGLDTEGAVSLDDYDGTGPTVVVVGSEGKGLSRLVRETCDSVLAIPMAGDVESLNASVAAGVVLADFARQRRQS